MFSSFWDSKSRIEYIPGVNSFLIVPSSVVDIDSLMNFIRTIGRYFLTGLFTRAILELKTLLFLSLAEVALDTFVGSHRFVISLERALAETPVRLYLFDSKTSSKIVA